MDAVVTVGVEVDVTAVLELVIVVGVVILVGAIEEKYGESLILQNVSHKQMYFSMSYFIPTHEPSDWHIWKSGQSAWELPSPVPEAHIVQFLETHTGTVPPHISSPQLQLPAPLAAAESHVSLDVSHIVA